MAPSGAGLLKVKVFWRQKARVVLRLKISGMIVAPFILENIILQIVAALAFNVKVIKNFKNIFFRKNGWCIGSNIIIDLNKIG